MKDSVYVTLNVDKLENVITNLNDSNSIPQLSDHWDYRDPHIYHRRLLAYRLEKMRTFKGPKRFEFEITSDDFEMQSWNSRIKPENAPSRFYVRVYSGSNNSLHFETGFLSNLHDRILFDEVAYKYPTTLSKTCPPDKVHPLKAYLNHGDCLDNRFDRLDHWILSKAVPYNDSTNVRGELMTFLKDVIAVNTISRSSGHISTTRYTDHIIKNNTNSFDLLEKYISDLD